MTDDHRFYLFIASARLWVGRLGRARRGSPTAGGRAAGTRSRPQTQRQKDPFVGRSHFLLAMQCMAPCGFGASNTQSPRGFEVLASRPAFKRFARLGRAHPKWSPSDQLKVCSLEALIMTQNPFPFATTVTPSGRNTGARRKSHRHPEERGPTRARDRPPQAPSACSCDWTESLF